MVTRTGKGAGNYSIAAEGWLQHSATIFVKQNQYIYDSYKLTVMDGNLFKL